MSAAMLLSAFPANVFAGESVEMAALSEEAEETAEVTLVGAEAPGETDGGAEVDGGTETGGSAEAQTAGQATGDVSGQEEQASQASGAAEDDSAVEEIVTPEIGAEEDEEEILIVDTGDADGDAGSEIDSEVSEEILLGEDEDDADCEGDVDEQEDVETETGIVGVTPVDAAGTITYDGKYKDFEYTITNNSVLEIKKYTGSDTKVTVPASIWADMTYEITSAEKSLPAQYSGKRTFGTMAQADVDAYAEAAIDVALAELKSSYKEVLGKDLDKIAGQLIGHDTVKKSWRQREFQSAI